MKRIIIMMVLLPAALVLLAGCQGKETELQPEMIKGKLAPFRNEDGYVTFGSYEQDNNIENGREPIEWLVLDYDAANHRALLLSRYALDMKPYNIENADNTWETCTLRAWLNREFIDNAFNAAEKDAILTTTVDNSSSQGYSKWNPDDGNNTQDRIFLLSYAEANQYLGVTWEDSKNMKSRTSPTAYARNQGEHTSSSDKTAEGQAAGWWLRSPGSRQGDAAGVSPYGSLGHRDVSYGPSCVRPALWIDLESDIF